MGRPQRGRLVVFAHVDGVEDARGGDLRWFVLQKPVLLEHVEAQLAGQGPDLPRVGLLGLVKLQHSEEPLQEERGVDGVHLELQSIEDSLLQLEVGVPGHFERMLLPQYSVHDVEGGREGQVELACEHEASDRERDQAGSFGPCTRQVD